MKRLTRKEFIDRSNAIHNNFYNYDKALYNGNRIKVTIICPIHGEFEQTPSNHFAGKGCRLCFDIKQANSKRMSFEEFVRRARELHGDKYDYSSAKYTGIFDKVTIICPIHGSFRQIANNHIRKSGCGCYKCKTSKGELVIANFLTKHRIDFIKEHSFEDCRNIIPLRFDFYIPNDNILIEFNGRQHYESVRRFGGKKALKQQQYRDNIKVKYAKENNINLIIIPYTDIDRIDEILSAKLS